MDYDRKEENEDVCRVTSCVGPDRMAKSKAFKWTMAIFHVIAFILGLAVALFALPSLFLDDKSYLLSCSDNVTGPIRGVEAEFSVFLIGWAGFLALLAVSFALLWCFSAHCYKRGCSKLWIAVWFLSTIGGIVSVVILGINYLKEAFPAWREDTSACSHVIVVLSVLIMIVISFYGMLYTAIAIISVTCEIVHKSIH